MHDAPVTSKALSDGNQCSCSACAATFTQFVRYGVPTRYGRCPQCGAKPRHRALLQFLSADVANALVDGTRVLEIGPGKFATRFLPHAQIIGDASYTAIDLRRLKHPAQRLQLPHSFMQASALAMPFADVSFDVILCNNTLPFISEDLQALREISRCLADDGIALLQSHRGDEPTLKSAEHAQLHPEISPDWYAENAHFWVYGPDFFDRVATVGLTASIILPFADASDEQCQRLGLKAHEELIVAFKSAHGAYRFGAKPFVTHRFGPSD